MYNPNTNSFFFMLVGFRVGTSVYAIHRNAAIWENPNVSEDNFANLDVKAHVFPLKVKF